MYDSTKFDSRLTERVYNLSLDGGADEECGSVQENGTWYGRFDFRKATVILSEDSQGFVYSSIIAKADADATWARIERDCNEADDSGV